MTRLILHLAAHDGETAPGNPRRTLVERQTIVEATGNPEVVRVVCWKIYQTPSGYLRAVRTGESAEHPDHIRRLVSGGWTCERMGAVDGFLGAVEAGKAYDPFAGAA